MPAAATQPVLFSLNYSRPAAELIRAGKLRIDRFKCFERRDVIEAAAPLAAPYIHFGLDAGSRTKPLPADFSTIAALLAETDTPYVNVHLAARQRDFPDLAGRSFDDPAWSDAALPLVLADVRRLTEFFGPHRVIVETLYHMLPADDFVRGVLEPQFASRVCAETGCGLLLDLAHATISAERLGIDVHRYISAMPVHELRELHVTGIGNWQGVRGDHLAMTDPDWKLFDWAIDQIAQGAWSRPWAIVSEYGGVGPQFEGRTDPQVMTEQLPRMQRAMGRVNGEMTKDQIRMTNQ